MNRLIGILLVAISAATFGTLAISTRYAYADGMDVFSILFLRFTLATVVMLVLLAVRRERLPRGRVLLHLVGMGALGYVGQAYCYLTAIKYASPGLVALLLYLYPSFVAILSVIFLRERLTWLKVIALVLALSGTALTVGPEGGQLLGALFAISAAIIYSVYIMVATNVMKQVSAVQSTTVIVAATGTVCGLLMLLTTGPQMPSSGMGWGAIAAMVVLATVVPLVTFMAGLERIGPTNAAMLSTLEPVVTVVLAAVLLGESLHAVAIVGGAMILVAVLILARGELRLTQSPPTGVLET